MKYVIIGNGVASVGAIEGIRRVDKAGEILVISEESVPTYGRPLISYFLAGKVDQDRLALRDEKFYVDSGVTMKLGTKVTALDPAARTVTTAAGESIAYDKLLLATGGAPFTPPLPGQDGPGVYKFTTLAHALALSSAAKKMRRAVVIGGGLIGLKAAESLHDRGVQVSIVELSPRVLSAAFDADAGRLVASRLEEAGIRVFTGLSAQEIRRDDDGQVKGVLLTDGRFLEAQAVVVAIGVVPCMELAKAAGLACERGVKVDVRLETSAKDVFAAGDVAQALDMVQGESRVAPIWPNAYSQGFHAGKVMAGAEDDYAGGLPMNSISFYGLPTASVGLVNPPEGQGFEIQAFLDDEKKTYRKLVFQDDRLVGYVLVGDIDFAGLYAGFIRFKLPLSAEFKQQIIDGNPSLLLWPEEFFDSKWNPMNRPSGQAAGA